MPSRMVKFKKNLQLLLFHEQISEINFAIDGMLKVSNTFDVKEDTDIKYSAINHLKALRSKIIKDNKGIMTFLYTLFVFIYCFVTIMIYNPFFFFFLFNIKLFFITNLGEKYNEENKPKVI